LWWCPAKDREVVVGVWFVRGLSRWQDKAVIPVVEGIVCRLGKAGPVGEVAVDVPGNRQSFGTLAID
jgi:hypothetical protein